MLVTVRNDLHETETTIHVRDGLVSLPQAYQAWRALCGSEGCQCGNALGMRGPSNVRIEPAADADGLSGYHFDFI